jgi:exonuclease VII large subunit
MANINWQQYPPRYSFRSISGQGFGGLCQVVPNPNVPSQVLVQGHVTRYFSRKTYTLQAGPVVASDIAAQQTLLNKMQTELTALGAI